MKKLQLRKYFILVSGGVLHQADTCTLMPVRVTAAYFWLWS